MAIERALSLFDDATWPFHDEDDMPESTYHVSLADYIKAVLMRLFVAEKWLIVKNLAVYPPNFSRPLTPDVGLFVGVVDVGQYIKSWRITDNHPAPTVVFELASDDTVAQDVYKKPPYYAALGVEEYYAYDPRPNTRAKTRLRGWQPGLNGQLVEMQPDAAGRLWSRTLESWLVADGALLRFQDANGTLRLTPEEAAEERARNAEAQIYTAETQMQIERSAREQAEAQVAALQARLRLLGLDPDNV